MGGGETRGRGERERKERREIRERRKVRMEAGEIGWEEFHMLYLLHFW